MNTTSHSFFLKPQLIGLVVTGITLGLATGSVLAHDDPSHDDPDAYDHSGAPHETPHKATPPEGGHESLAGAATNPIANLVQFQLQNQYNWENHNSSGYANQFLIQPVAPFKLPFEKVPLLVTRTTVPYVSTPDLGTGVNRKHGFGDTTFLALGIPDFGLKGQMIGLGLANVIPTAGDNDFTGNGKWLTGPAAIYINLRTPKLQWGLLGWHYFTVGETSAGSDKKNVTRTSVQPILTKHFDKGWYLAMQDVTWDYNHKSGNWSTPIGPRLGRVFKMGKSPVNVFGAAYYNPNDDGANTEWMAKINLTLLFPK